MPACRCVVDVFMQSAPNPVEFPVILTGSNGSGELLN
jgi:hypothetical protein